MARYDFTIIHALEATNDEQAKQQAADILRAIAILRRSDVIDFTKIGMQLLDPSRNEIDLTPPQFPKGRKTE